MAPSSTDVRGRTRIATDFTFDNRQSTGQYAVFSLKHGIMSRPLADESVFRVIGHSARRAILDRLRRGEQTVGELLEVAKLSRATMSEHLRMLRNAGVISQERSGRRRVYRLEAGSLRAVSTWVAPFDRSMTTTNKRA